jgi:hypothetical protein
MEIKLRSTRVTLNNKKLSVSTDKLIELRIKTRVPNKYILIDAENGRVYNGTDEQYHMDWIKVDIDKELVLPIIEALYIP